MTAGTQDIIGLSKLNRKKAYGAMCRVTVLLFGITLFAVGLRLAVTFLLDRFFLEISGFLANLFECFGFGKQNAVLAAKSFLSSLAFNEFLGTVIGAVTLVIPVAIFAKSVNVSADESCAFNGRFIKNALLIYSVCWLFTLAASVFSNAIFDFLLPDGPLGVHSSDAASFPGSGTNIYSFIINILWVGIFVPFSEEYAFRGVIFSYLRRFGLSFGIVASSVIFGIAHSSPVQSVYAFVFGLISAFLVTVTGNLKTSVLFHALNNITSIVAEYVSQFMGPDRFTLLFCVCTMCMILLGFVALYKLIVNERIVETFEIRVAENDAGLIIKPGFAQIMTIPTVIYIIYYLVTYLPEVMG